MNGGGNGKAHEPRRAERLVFLVQDETGYLNLIKLTSIAFLETPTAPSCRRSPSRIWNAMARGFSV